MRTFRGCLARAAIALVVLIGTCAILWAMGPSVFMEPLPPHPTIAAPPGPLPQGLVVFRERAPGGPCVGSGWYLRLPNDVVAVTVSHSHPGWLGHSEFTGPDCGQTLAAFNALYVPRGRPAERHNLTVDYTIMRTPAAPDAALVLEPDPRGVPQAGEDVVLFHGLGDGAGGQGTVSGTIESVEETAAWVRMPAGSVYGGMSGSPVLSVYTGKVVGMVVVSSPRPGAVVIGINPIGALLAAAGVH